MSAMPLLNTYSTSVLLQRRKPQGCETPPRDLEDVLVTEAKTGRIGVHDRLDLYEAKVCSLGTRRWLYTPGGGVLVCDPPPPPRVLNDTGGGGLYQL